MKASEIRELIELISRSNFKTFELERENFRIKLVKEDAWRPEVGERSAPVATTLAQLEPAAPAPVAAAVSPEPAAAASAAETNGLHELNSPIVGTFFSAPSPDAPNFVEVGNRVAQGQVLCIVEAMKVMNEIESEIDGEVVEILISNGQPVEFGEVLFRIRPA